MLPTNFCPFLCIRMGDTGQDFLYEFKVIEFDTGTIQIGKLFSVSQFSLPPEEFDTVQVRSIRSIPDKRDLFLGEPLFYLPVVVDGSVVHVDAPLVTGWQSLLSHVEDP